MHIFKYAKVIVHLQLRMLVQQSKFPENHLIDITDYSLKFIRQCHYPEKLRHRCKYYSRQASIHRLVRQRENYSDLTVNERNNSRMTHTLQSLHRARLFREREREVFVIVRKAVSRSVRHNSSNSKLFHTHPFHSRSSVGTFLVNRSELVRNEPSGRKPGDPLKK